MFEMNHSDLQKALLAAGFHKDDLADLSLEELQSMYEGSQASVATSEMTHAELYKALQLQGIHEDTLDDCTLEQLQRLYR